MAGIDVKWFEHTDPIVQNAFQGASEYHLKDRTTFKAYQAQQPLALHVEQVNQSATYFIPTNHWLVVDNIGLISVYSDADFQNLFELKT